MFLYVTTLLALCLVLWMTYHNLEGFTNVPLLIYNITRSNLDINIVNHTETNLSSLSSVDHINANKDCMDCNLVVQDAYTFFESQQPMKLIAVMPTEKTMMFVKQRNLEITETVRDVFLNKTIGYLEDSHERLLQMLAIAFGARNPSLVKVKKPDVSETYCVFLYHEVEKNNILANNVDADVLDLGNFDINILKAYLPYILVKNKDFKLLIDGYIDRYSIKSCFTFDNLLVGDSTFDERKYANIVRDIHKTLQDVPKLHFYSMIINKIESFEESTPPLDFEPKRNVPGFFEAASSSLTVLNNKIEGVVLRPLDKVTLSYQERSEENGTYLVKEINRNTIVLEKEKPMLQDTVEQQAKYVCVGDPTKLNMNECMTDDNNTWDRPCEQNIECPFYQKNKLYKNYRGGCIDGSCEMPVGVIRRGFRSYDRSTSPICYDCPLDNPTCCDQQDLPNYVFSLDYFEKA